MTINQACRFCATPLHHLVVDLGMSPLCESFLAADQLRDMEPFYPLQAYVCERCYLVQVLEHVSGEAIFGGEYAYFSSYSDSWLAHCENYVHEMIERFGFTERSQVIEVASNDGYLLQYFVERGIPALGIEPAENVAKAAGERGVKTLVRFFGRQLARELASEGTHADLLLGNNVLAHVPDLNDFVRGMKTLLAPQGVITLEFPHLARLIEGNQFDTIYQEHYCYFSLGTVREIFAAHGLVVFDALELPTHGGSLRVYARHAEHQKRKIEPTVEMLCEREREAGLRDLAVYAAFGERVAETKRKLLEFLIQARRAGKRIAGYGAPGKGNTLLNYCGIRQDFVDYVVDRNPYKHGKFLPGTHIPVFAPARLAETRPDYILILPWNLENEILEQLAYARDWGARFVVPIPQLKVIS